jgi:flagellar L-ring protein precursor FlgH
MRLLPLLAVALGLAACATPPPPDTTSYARQVPVLPPPTRGSIYQAGAAMSLFSDNKARHAGDLLTIQLLESTSASKSAKTSASKDQDIEMDPPIILGQTPTLNGLPLGTSLKGARAFNGEGDSSQSNRLSGFITVTVVERLPNGNLVIAGEKLLTLNQGDEVVHIAGVVRPSDIGTNNVVASFKVADARISYSGRGAIAESNQMGWLARFFNSGWVPY